MAINFPDSPSVNDTFMVSGSVYVWSGVSWNAVNTVTDVQSLINESVSDLVDSAPETLDTLNELAAALGDDANFATTVTSSIATKQDKVSGVSDTEIGHLDGVTSAIQDQIDAKQPIVSGVSDIEIGYLDGVTSAIQTQIDSKQATLTGASTTIASDNLTVSRALASDGSGKVAVSSVTATELGHLSGVTSAIQTQINAKSPTASPTFTGTVTATGNVNPQATNAYDLGTSSLRWRNIYTQDLHLSNGIGDYTLIEGEENLYLTNNKNGKSYKFALIEVDPSEIPPKSEV
jgi:hypothetical protein